MFKLIPDSVWQLLKAELEAKREDNRRLTEALARQNGTPVQLPHNPELAAAIAAMPEIPSSGWYDTKPYPKANPSRKESKQ